MDDEKYFGSPQCHKYLLTLLLEIANPLTDWPGEFHINTLQFTVDTIFVRVFTWLLVINSRYCYWNIVLYRGLNIWWLICPSLSYATVLCTRGVHCCWVCQIIFVVDFAHDFFDFATFIIRQPKCPSYTIRFCKKKLHISHKSWLTVFWTNCHTSRTQAIKHHGLCKNHV